MYCNGMKQDILDWECTAIRAWRGCICTASSISTVDVVIDQCVTFGQCAQYDDCVGCPAEVVQ